MATTQFDYSEEEQMGNSFCRMGAYALSILWTTAALAAPQFKVLHNFVGTDGAYSWSKLVQASDGNFYGTTQNGGTSTACTNGCGTVFKVTPAGKVTTMISFDVTHGSAPFAGLVQGTNGDLYGTTSGGGSVVNASCSNGCGTAFKMALSGKFTTLFSFNYLPDGAGPMAALVQGTDGNFYGSTNYGDTYNAGTIFKITPAGKLTTLHDFNFSPDGAAPTGALVEGPDGEFYGTTFSGGVNNEGVAFKVKPGNGNLTVLYAFTGGVDGYAPYAGLTLGTDGNFYGVTEAGGTYVAYGTAFKMTPAGALTTLHSFDVIDGDVPVGNLVQATDGNFYGTTAYGGASETYSNKNYGTIFKLTPDGTLTTVHSFSGMQGSYPYAGLTQAKNGKLYAPTFAGGTSKACRFGCGAVFSLSLGH